MKKAIAWGLCVLWMGLIFSMSAQTAAVSDIQSEQVAGLMQQILSLLSFGRFSIPPDSLNLVIRKIAHFAEYAVLGLLLRRALRLSGVKHAGLAAVALSAFYAVTDELHQGFVDGRSPRMLDVVIDTLGASAGAWFHSFAEHAGRTRFLFRKTVQK
ncbi:MAG: VanZ family protein [Clostridia bacterium]|nr:VanZ family protein [Clostridia bacterium]